MSRLPALLMNLAVAALFNLCTSPTFAAPAEQADDDRSDAEITKSVQAALLPVRGSDSHDIDVQTRNGVVQLTGIVGSGHTREMAEKAAMDVPGVRHVRNDVLVREHASSSAMTEAPSSDAVIAARVKTELAGESGLATASDVDVDVNDGVVRLRGVVSTAAERSEIESVARRVEGVTAVRNNVEVQPER